MAEETHVDLVREFNRFYSARVGMTRYGLHRTTHALAEARVLFELGTRGELETSALRFRLEMDAGQLSRLLKRLEDEGVLERRPSPQDGRRQLVRLTADGEEAFAVLDERSREEIGGLLDGLRDPEPLLAALDTVRRLIGGERSSSLRDLRIGDLGWLVERHGVLYAREYGWDQSFERLVARIAADFDPQTDRGWIAEVDGLRAGAVLCTHEDAATARLRTLLVEPFARGDGLGTRLVEDVIEHARRRGYERLTLWTNDVLVDARRLYEKQGFALEHEAPHRAFGQDLTEQTWSLTLKPWTETS